MRLSTIWMWGMLPTFLWFLLWRLFVRELLRSPNCILRTSSFVGKLIAYVHFYQLFLCNLLDLQWAKYSSSYSYLLLWVGNISNLLTNTIGTTSKLSGSQLVFPLCYWYKSSWGYQCLWRTKGLRYTTHVIDPVRVKDVFCSHWHSS